MEETTKAAIEAYLAELLGILEEEVSFEITEEADEEIYVNLTGNLFSLPEERPVLASLEQLIRLAVHSKTGKDRGITIDVNGEVTRRRAELIRFALSTAESVRREHKRVRLNPMPSRERRTIHITLANFPGVKTYSIGQGDERRVVIEPDDT